ncbi:hypothetical protein GY45DRAFT_661471 [Cubamyces sp. BRFM 1775]|nr:hypothetical protein GY45DRAFT_661471 [Cubamyces sp. BRFM 1775]
MPTDRVRVICIGSLNAPLRRFARASGGTDRPRQATPLRSPLRRAVLGEGERGKAHRNDERCMTAETHPDCTKRDAWRRSMLRPITSLPAAYFASLSLPAPSVDSATKLRSSSRLLMGSVRRQDDVREHGALSASTVVRRKQKMCSRP